MLETIKIFSLTTFCIYGLGMALGNEGANAYERQLCEEKKLACKQGAGCDVWKDFPFTADDASLDLGSEDFFSTCNTNGCNVAFRNCCLNSNDENNCG